MVYETSNSWFNPELYDGENMRRWTSYYIPRESNFIPVRSFNDLGIK